MRMEFHLDKIATPWAPEASLYTTIDEATWVVDLPVESNQNLCFPNCVALKGYYSLHPSLL